MSRGLGDVYKRQEYDPLKIDKDTTSQILEEMDEEEDEDESE